VPATKRAGIEAAADCGADVIVLDLAEFVSENDKPRARASFRDALTALTESGAAVFAQVLPSSLAADLSACAWPGLSGVVISRVESAAHVLEAAQCLDDFEGERGIAGGEIEIVAALETAPGNHAAYDIVSASHRVTAATLGRADLIMDLRPEPSGDIHLMPYLMQRLIVVAGAAGITPLGAWWRAPARGLLASAEHTYDAGYRGRAIGFKGAMCLRVDQVDALNRAFGELALPS
jgi:citrate lyase beta subunit